MKSSGGKDIEEKIVNSMKCFKEVSKNEDWKKATEFVDVELINDFEKKAIRM